MRNGDLDDRVGEVVAALVRVSRMLGTEDVEDLLGSLMVEIDLGMQLAEEAALERKMRRRPGGKVVPFPVTASMLPRDAT